MSPEATRALAFRQLSALLNNDIPLGEAISSLAEGLPSGPVQQAFKRAHTRVTGGMEPSKALSALVPHELVGLIHTDDESLSDASLPPRVQLAADHLSRLHRLRSHITTIARYPIIVASGALLTLLAVLFAVFLLRQSFSAGNWARNLPIAGGTIGGLVSYLIISAVWARKQGTIAGWARALPGGRVGRLNWLAQFFGVLAVLRDERFGQHSPSTAMLHAAKAMPLERSVLQPDLRRQIMDAAVAVTRGLPVARALRNAGIPPREAIAYGCGERSGRAAEAARTTAKRLEREAFVSGQVFLRSLAVALILASGFCLLILVSYMYGTLQAYAG